MKKSILGRGVAVLGLGLVLGATVALPADARQDPGPKPTVTATLSGDGAVLQVDVAGTAATVLPGIELRVAKRAAGAVERPAP